MKVLLDENFPLQLHRRLVAAGREAEHIILLDQRGLQDAAIRRRLSLERLLFLTQDTEFLGTPSLPSIVIVSRIDQSLSIQHRVEIWFRAVESYLSLLPRGDVFELLDDERLLPWSYPTS